MSGIDPEIRAYHLATTPDLTGTEGQRWRKGVVAAFHAGPPRTADVTEGGSDTTADGCTLLSRCPNLTAGDVVWMVRIGDTRLIIDTEG